MKKIFALLLATVLCLAICGCSQTGASGAGRFAGTWELGGMSWLSQGRMTISVSGNTATVTLGNGQSVSVPFTLGSTQGYEYMTLSAQGQHLLFVLVSENMLAVANESYDKDQRCALTIDGVTYQGEFATVNNMFMRSGSSTKTLPYSGMLASFDGVREYCYYPNERIVCIQTDYEAGIFYVESAQKQHYMERISLPIASNLPYDVICTQSGFIITDDK